MRPVGGINVAHTRVLSLLPHHRCCPLSALLLAMAGGVVAQESQVVPAFPVQAQAITVDVVVIDRGGRDVLGLTRQDFTILDDGTPHEIVSFEAPSRPSIDSSPAAPGSEPAPAGDVSAQKVQPRKGRVFALVFDDRGIGPLTATDVKKALVSWIESRVEDGDEVTLLSTGGDVFWSGPLNRGRADLLAAVERLAGRRPPESVLGMSDWESYQIALDPEDRFGVKERVKQRWLQNGHCTINKEHGIDNCGPLIGATAMERESARRSHAVAVLDRLARLSGALGGQPGRKAVVLFAEEFIRDHTFEAETRRTIEAGRRTNTAFYFVAARGLRGPSFFRAEASANASPIPGQVGLMNVEEAFLATGGGEHLAEETGGAIIRNTNDLAGGLGRVTDDSSSYYLLGYQPARAPDGKWHKIEVKVARPGVKVRARRGYLAAATAEPAGIPHELALWSALGSPTLPRDFEFRSGVLHLGAKEKEREALVLVEVPLAAVRLTGDEDRRRFSGRLSALANIKDEAGRSVRSLAVDWPIEGPLEQMESARRSKALVKRLVRLAPGSYTLDTAILDGGSLGVSAERRPFQLPPASPGLATGSLVVLDRAEPAGTARPSDDPLVVGSVALVPALDASIPAARGEVAVLLKLYLEPKAAPAELVLELRRGGETLIQTKPQLPPADEQGHVAWIGKLHTGRLPPGRYVLRATARQGSATSEELAEFELAARPAAAASRPRSGGEETPPALARPAAPQSPQLARLLERAAAYVKRYDEAFRFVAAEEEYDQWVEPPYDERGRAVSHRRTRGDLVFVRTPTVRGSPWTSFRDTFEVDGQAVRDREGRLEKLFRGEALDSALRQAAAILEESGRYNIGTANRSINVPTLALMFLHPENEGRFRFELGKTRWFHGVEGVEVEFEEVARPTIVTSVELGDLPASGRFWIDATRGVVLRSEASFTIPPGRARGRVAVDYTPRKDLTIWLPERMTELYQDLSGVPFFKGRTECSARYSNYRYFDVSVSEEARRP